MAFLQIIIDNERGSARFSGSGTFDNKERIKELGGKWMTALKLWEIRPCSLSAAELQARFPDAEVVDADSDAEPAVPAEAPPKRKAAPLPLRAPTTAPAEFDFDNESSVSDELPKSESGAALVPGSLSVTEFVGRIRQLLTQSFSSVVIYGVLRDVNRQQSGRVFLEIGDADAPDERVRAAIWSDEDRICSALHSAGIRLEPDLQVMFRCKVSFSGRGGYVSLTVVSIVAEYTIAKLRAQRDMTNERLKKEGLYGRNKQLELPMLPRRLGILTSFGGTVIHDFRASLDEASFGFELFWFPVLVQGQDAKKSILEGISVLSALPQLDAILLFRGGGSPAELAIFSDYDVAKAICLAPVPVISAIGHQEDESSTQDVSYRGGGVPKDVGRFFADIVRDLRMRFAESVTSIKRETESILDQRQESVTMFARLVMAGSTAIVRLAEERVSRVYRSLPVLATRAVARAGERCAEKAAPIAARSEGLAAERGIQLMRLSEKVVSVALKAADGARHRVETVARRSLSLAERIEDRERAKLRRLGTVPREMEHLIRSREAGLKGYEQLLEGVSPTTQLARGFAIVKAESDGRYITDGAALPDGARLQIEFRDGVRSAEIKGEKGGRNDSKK